MPKMIVSIEGVVVREVRLSKDRTSLGRRPYNDVVFDNLAVSGEHAVVSVSQGDYTIEDLNSTNGTYVNGRSITRHTLRHGDAIEIGKYRVKFYQDNHEDDHERVTIVDDGAALLSGEAKDHGRLLVLNGNAAGKAFTLNKPSTTIGKPSQAVIAISRQSHGHSVAVVEGAVPVTLNGETLTTHGSPLQSGDLIEIGGVQMQFHRL
jgi:pSer/pThr/pTyr-binding forkhead associated (FHA) protein